VLAQGGGGAVHPHHGDACCPRASPSWTPWRSVPRRPVTPWCRAASCTRARRSPKVRTWRRP
jgi:hypothetical protein